jgi:hypothetical protein
VFDSKDAYGLKYRAFRDSINSAGVSFALHAGDIKDGGTPCTDLYYNRFFSLSNALNAPSLLSLGDNEWTDCHRTGSDPIERLSYVRARFYNPSGLTKMGGGTPIQTSSFGIAPYVENQYFVRDGIMFALLHVVGSNNNLYSRCPSTLAAIDRGCKAATAEYTARDKAVTTSLRTVFANAKQQQLKGVMIVIQANFWGGTAATCNALRLSNVTAAASVSSGYKNFVQVLMTEISNYNGGQVAVVHGDTHFYRLCNPTVYPNVKFLMVPGATDMNWVLASIDASRSTDIFTFYYINGTLPRLPIAQPQSAPRAAPVSRFSVPPPLASPVLAPSAPVAAPQANVVSTPVCSVAYKVYNGATDQFVVDIVANGTVVDPPCGVNIEAVISCDEPIDGPVTMTLRRIADQKLVHSQTEEVWPYFLFGNDGDDVYSGTIGKARFHIQTQSSVATINSVLPSEGTFFRMGKCV